MRRGEQDVRLGGGLSTIRQYLSAALIDELHLAILPVLLGDGEHLPSGLNLPALGYECVERIEGARATHVTLRKRSEDNAPGCKIPIFTIKVLTSDDGLLFPSFSRRTPEPAVLTLNNSLI